MLFLCLALFFPDITLIVVTSLFPESGLVVGEELEPAQPFSAFPEINILEIIAAGDGTDEPAQGKAMFGCDWLAIKMGGEQEGVCLDKIDGHIGSVPIFSMLQDEPGGRFGPGQPHLDQGVETHTTPLGIEFTPAGDAVQIELGFDAGQAHEIIKGQGEGLFNFTPDPEIPDVGIEGRDRAIMQNWKFHSQRLPGGQAAGFAHGFFALFSFSR